MRHRLVLPLIDRGYHQRIKSRFLTYLPDNLDDHGLYARQVTERLGYALSEGITPLTLKQQLMKSACRASLYLSGSIKKVRG